MITKLYTSGQEYAQQALHYGQEYAHKDAQTGTTIHVQMNSHYNTNTTSETPTDGHIQLQNTLNINTLEDIR